MIQLMYSSTAIECTLNNQVIVKLIHYTKKYFYNTTLSIVIEGHKLAYHKIGLPKNPLYYKDV